MFDTHSHLDGTEFLEDFDEVLDRAKQNGIEKILLPNIDENTLPRILKLCSTHRDVLYPMIGLHPEEVDPTKRDIDSVLDSMEEQLKNGSSPVPFIAIGEIGLDLYWDETYKSEQLAAFERQVEWGIKYHLPLMIHCRKAHEEMLAILNKFPSSSLSGVFHCFTGTAEEASQLLKYENFVFGIGGVLTFKKSKLPEVLQEIVPLSRIVLETDSPYMAPVPHRGQRNESSFVIEVARKLADIYNVSLSEVERVTNDNANRLFTL